MPPQTNLGVDRMWSLEEGEFGCAAAPECPTQMADGIPRHHEGEPEETEETE